MSSNIQQRALLLSLPLVCLSLTACGEKGGGGSDDATAGDTADTADTAASSSGNEGQSTDAGETGDGDGDQNCVEILGNCSHDPGTLVIETVLDTSDQLNEPTDVEFNSDIPNELWVTNRADYSMVIAQGVGTPGKQSVRIQENFGGGVHFLAKPAALAFGQPGTLATAQQEDDWTQPQTPFDFMGPTMWGSSLNTFDGGHAGHLDMLHNSPLSSGIAWAGGNVYWIYDGAHGSLSRYDFVQDHGLGGTDHTDGIMHRYIDGALGYEPGVASHVVYDFDTGFVYAADTANGRVVAIDPANATDAGVITPNYDGGTQRRYNGAESWIVADGPTLDPVMAKPSGMEMHDGMLFVSDYASARIYAFGLDGTLYDWLETGFAPNSIMGIEFDEAGSLYVVDHSSSQVLKISVAQ